MSKVNVVRDRISKLLTEQNVGIDVKVRYTKLTINDIQIEVKTPSIFLQINNLAEILNNSFFTKAIFIIEKNTTFNIQSAQYEYEIRSAEGCSIYSFYTNRVGNVPVQLGKGCAFIYKGSHTIKSNVDCVIENANSKRK